MILPYGVDEAGGMEYPDLLLPPTAPRRTSWHAGPLRVDRHRAMNSATAILRDPGPNEFEEPY